MRYLPLVLACIACPALGSDWRQVAGDDDATFQIDIDSIKREGPIRQIWLRANYSEEVKRDNGDTYRSSVHRATVNCDAQTFGWGQSVGYKDLDGQGKSVFSRPQPARVVMQEMPPDSVGSSIIRSACGRSPPPATALRSSGPSR